MSRQHKLANTGQEDKHSAVTPLNSPSLYAEHEKQKWERYVETIHVGEVRANRNKALTLPLKQRCVMRSA